MNREIQELLCKKCSEELYEKIGECEKCHRVRQVHRSQKTEEILCARCQKAANRKVKKCSDCGEHKPIYGYTKDKEPLCRRCLHKQKPEQKKKCSLCQEIKHVAIRIHGGGVACDNCRLIHSLRRGNNFVPEMISSPA